MDRESWDWEAQRAETIEQINGMEHPWRDAEMEIVITIRTVSEDPDQDGLPYGDALSAAGFEFHEDDYEDDIVWVSAKARFNPDSIWTAERRVSEIALDHGYTPEGWEITQPTYP